ncbi:MAG: hypothetical protein L7S64_03100 [Longimicrobiales bacterium]|nr:hypothetical protein [Longimicrobiales bacterium]
MATWCFGPYASLRGFGNGGPNPRYLLTVYLLLNGLGAEHVIRWYLHRGFLLEQKDCNHVLSIFTALKTDQFARQGKTYKHLLVANNYKEMSQPKAGDAWMVLPIPETSHDLGIMQSIGNATIMLKTRSPHIPDGIPDTLGEELRIEAQAEFNFFSAPTERSRLMGSAYDTKQVNVFNHLKVQTVHHKALPTRGISKITTRRIPGKLVAGPYPAAYYADLETKTSQPNTYYLHANAMAEDVGSCAIEHGVAPIDASVIYKAPCVNVSINNNFPILNRGEWVKQVNKPNLAPLHLLGQEQ